MKGKIFMSVMCTICLMAAGCQNTAAPETAAETEAVSESAADTSNVPETDTMLSSETSGNSSEASAAETEVLSDEISAAMTSEDGDYMLTAYEIPAQTVCTLTKDDGTGWQTPEGTEFSFNYTLAHGTQMQDVDLEIGFRGTDEAAKNTDMDGTSGFISFVGSESDTQRYIYVGNYSDIPVTIQECVMEEK